MISICRQQHLKAAGILAFGLISSALSTACTQERVEIVHPPASLLTCAEEPQAPSLPGQDQQAERDSLTLDYLLGLRSAYGDCKSKVAGLAAWSEGLE